MSFQSIAWQLMSEEDYGCYLEERMSYIERMNYENDPRVRNKAPTTVIEIDTEDGTHEVELPTKWVICDTCSGDGTHVNPSIDAGGLCAEDFHDDPDFADNYMSGMYDVQCYTCSGSGKVREVDLDQLSDELRDAYERQLEDDAQYEAMCRAERIMGA